MKWDREIKNIAGDIVAFVDDLRVGTLCWTHMGNSLTGGVET